MQKVLFIGRNPLEHSGNGNMLNALARQLDTTLYSPICLGIGDQSTFLPDETTLPYKLIQTGTSDFRVVQHMLFSTIEHFKPSALVVVGLDVWDLAPLHDSLNGLKRRDHFVTVGIMPYDLMHYRDDWAGWFNFYDFPCVYSEYGYEMLKNTVPNLRYYRPLLSDHELFAPSTEARKQARQRWSLTDDSTFVFGFVGANQIRKDPLRLVKAFAEFKRHRPKGTALYMHTEMSNGVYTFQSYSEDCGLKMGDIITKTQGRKYTVSEMVEVYNGIDCLINCTLQEGLSWTPLEAMLCGTPVIASKNTAHVELLENCGLLVPSTELAYVPVRTKYGAGWVETYACSVQNMVNTMLTMYDTADIRNDCAEAGLHFGKLWMQETHNINDLMKDALVQAKPLKAAFVKRKDVLFAQHSSAGDVLITTAILSQIKERHPDKKLVYMTQRQFADIVEGHPAIDEIIFWDESKLTAFEIVYNPHGQRILPGKWNSLDMMLHNMYAYYTRTNTGMAKISPKKVEFALPPKFIVVHTTGGHYSRVYKNLNVIMPFIQQLGYEAVQLGGVSDWAVPGAIDLRGTLTYRETAYVMQHATAAITVDSFLSHLAACLEIPQVCLFGPAPARVTRPYVEDAKKLICIEPNRYDVCPICGACYGDYKCPSPCIGSISPFAILEQLKTLLPEDGK